MTGWHVSPTPYRVELMQSAGTDEPMLVIFDPSDPVMVDAIVHGWIAESDDRWHIAGDVDRVEWAPCEPCAEHHATPEFWHTIDGADDGCDLGEPRHVAIVDIAECDADCTHPQQPRTAKPAPPCAGQLSIDGDAS